MDRIALRAASAALVGVLSSAVNADIINISGNSAASTEGLGAFTGTLNYTGLTSTTGSLVVTITNTTAPATGGFITGVVVMHSTNAGGLSMSLASTNDADFLTTGSESASPFGTYIAGAALGGDWLGGGSPNPGTGIGSTLILTFNVSGTGAGALSAGAFVGLQNEQQNFVVRFRGMNNGGSDKVPGMVPGPSALAGLGMASIFAGRRRRA